MGNWYLTQNQFSLDWLKIWPNKKCFALCAVCSVQKNFCLNLGLASQEKSGSETGKIWTNFERLNVKHCTSCFLSPPLNRISRKINFCTTALHWLPEYQFCKVHGCKCIMISSFALLPLAWHKSVSYQNCVWYSDFTSIEFITLWKIDICPFFFVCFEILRNENDAKSSTLIPDNNLQPLYNRRIIVAFLINKRL